MNNTTAELALCVPVCARFIVELPSKPSLSSERIFNICRCDLKDVVVVLTMT